MNQERIYQGSAWAARFREGLVVAENNQVVFQGCR